MVVVHKDRIPNIENSINFWMVRTESGKLFEEFIEKQFIAIGWNELSKEALSNTAYDSLVLFAQNKYDVQRGSFVVNKCRRFIFELKENDLAMIVGDGVIAFASIGSYYEETEKAEYKHGCSFIKRRNISLIKVVRTNTISPYLQQVIQMNRHTLSNLNEYSQHILSSCYDIFTDGNTLAITLRVSTNKKIGALDLSNLISSVAKMLSVEDSQNITVKTNLNSPGNITIEVFNFVAQNIDFALAILAIIFSPKVMPLLPDFVSKVFNIPSDIKLRKLDVKEKELLIEEKQMDIAKKRTENVLLLYETSEKLKLLRPETEAIQEIEGDD